MSTNVTATLKNMRDVIDSLITELSERAPDSPVAVTETSDATSPVYTPRVKSRETKLKRRDFFIRRIDSRQPTEDSKLHLTNRPIKVTDTPADIRAKYDDLDTFRTSLQNFYRRTDDITLNTRIRQTNSAWVLTVWF